MTDDEPAEVERTETGIEIKTAMTRGTDVRDQEKHTLVTKERTLSKAIDTHAAGVEYLKEDLAPRVRKIQPGDD